METHVRFPPVHWPDELDQREAEWDAEPDGDDLAPAEGIIISVLVMGVAFACAGALVVLGYAILS